MQSTVKLVGVRDLSRALDRLPIELQRSAERAVLRAGAKPILKAAKSKVVKASGLLKKSLGTNVKKLKGETTARVGPRKGYSGKVKRGNREVFQNPSKYSHLVEYGTSHSAAKPFIRPAVDSTQGEVVGAMAAGLDTHLTKVVRKLKTR